MSNATHEDSSEVQSASDEDISVISSVQKDKDWVEGFLESRSRPLTSNEAQNTNSSDLSALSLRVQTALEEEHLRPKQKHKPRPMRPAKEDISDDEEWQLVAEVHLENYRLRSHNASLKRSLEQVKCDSELRIANLMFQLNLKQKQFDDKSNELKTTQRLVEDQRKNLTRTEHMLQSARSENSSLKQSRQEALDLAQQCKESSTSVISEKHVALLELENERKLRQAIESEQRMLSSNVLQRLHAAKETAIVAENDKERFQEESRKLKCQLKELDQQHSQNENSLKSEIKQLKVNLSEAMCTIEMKEAKDSKQTKIVDNLVAYIKCRLERAEQRLLSFEGHLENDILCLEESFNLVHKTMAQRLNNTHNQLECSICVLRSKLNQSIALQSGQRDASKDFVKLKKSVQSYSRAFEKQKEYCVVYEYVIRDLVRECQAFEAEFEAICKSNKALENKLRNSEAQIVTLTRKLADSIGNPEYSRAKFHETQDCEKSCKESRTAQKESERKLKIQKTAIRQYKSRISCLQAQKDLLLRQLPRTHKSKQHIRDLIVRKIDPRMLENIFLQ